jgi:CDP-diglyceride synthetase
LAVALYGLYGKGLVGTWRWIYVACAVSALYLNVLVLIVQSFQKVPKLQVLAPTQSEPPFLITQSAALVVFLIVGVVAALRFHPAASRPA